MRPFPGMCVACHFSWTHHASTAGRGSRLKCFVLPSVKDVLHLVVARSCWTFPSQAYGLESDTDDGADINEEVLDWNGEFQVSAYPVHFP